MQKSTSPEDAAVLQVMEAILAAMLLFGAIMFVTLTANPVNVTTVDGVNYGDVAEDALTVLANQPGRIDASITRLEEVVDLALQGDDSEAEDFISDVVPPGSRFALRLDNGIEPLQLVPSSGTPLSTPRDASGASVFLLGNWTANPASGNPVSHGDELDFSGWTGLVAPDGSSTGPGGDTWLEVWTSLEPAQNSIPAAVPFGEWDCTGAGCTDFRITLKDGTSVDRPLYSVQLLIWEGV